MVDKMEMRDFTELTEYKAAIVLWKYVSPVLLATGLVGNIIVIIVLSMSSMKLTTTSLYLRFLAVFDMLVLFTGLLRHWIMYLFDYDLRVYSPAACKTHTWAVYWTSYTSAWLLVSVTLERCWSVLFPHQVKAICTRRKTYITIVFIIIFMAVLNAHYFYGLGDYLLSDGNETTTLHCASIYDDYYEFERNIWPWVDFCVYSVIPSSILSVCNISIIYKVVSTNRKLLPITAPNENSIQSRRISSRRNQASSLTAMLVVTSATYVVCTTPFCIYAIYLNVFVYSGVSSAQDMAVTALVLALVTLLQYTNNSINFILYCVSGQRFRDELRGLLLHCK